MSVKLKITVIVLLGVASCIGIALLSNVFVAKSERAGDLRATIEQALVQAVNVRLAERQFLESASEEDWEQIQKRLEATQAKLSTAQAMSDKWTAPIDELQSLLQDYKSDVKQLRMIVLAINSGLADFAAKSQMLSAVLQDNVIQPVNEAEASAALFDQKVSPTLLALKPYALALGEQLSAERLITQELFLFNNRQNYEAQKEKLEKLFKVRKKNLFSTLNMLGEQHDMLAAKNAIDFHLQQFFTLQENLAGLHASLMELSQTFQALGNKLLSQSRKLVTSMQQSYQQERLQNQQLSWGVVAVVALVLALLGLFIGRSIIKPLTALRRFAAQVAAGDLDARPEGAFKAEMAQLEGDIQSMVSGLKDIMDRVELTAQQAKEEENRACTAMLEAQQAKSHAETARKEGMLQAAERLNSIVQSLSSATEQLFGQVQQFNATAQQQSEQAERTSTVMSQMNSSVLEVARNASTTAQSAEETREHAAKGSNIVDQSIEAIARVHAEAQELKAKMIALDEQAASIGSVMDVINDIADQTNLLALNAAIEAARAGEAGRGFAVVADEVRKLAEKTMGATREVGNAIAAIQDGARKGVASMDAAGQAVETATQLAQNSGQALTRIVDLVRETSDQISSIASAAEQQSSASEQISATVDEISSSAGSTRDAASEAMNALEEVKGLTNDLVGLIQELQQEMA